MTFGVLFNSSTKLCQIGNLGRLTFRSMSSTPKNIGFIGLGNMGSHMSNNLMKKVCFLF